MSTDPTAPRQVAERDYFPCAFCHERFDSKDARGQHEEACNQEPDRPIWIGVDRTIPLAEVTRALNAFGFAVHWKAGELRVIYAPEPKRTRTEDVSYPREQPPETREVPIPDADDDSYSEATRHQFLDAGYEP